MERSRPRPVRSAEELNDTSALHRSPRMVRTGIRAHRSRASNLAAPPGRAQLDGLKSLPTFSGSVKSDCGTEAKMVSIALVELRKDWPPRTGPTSSVTVLESEGGCVQPRHDIKTKLPARLAIIRTARPRHRIS